MIERERERKKWERTVTTQCSSFNYWRKLIRHTFSRNLFRYDDIDVSYNKQFQLTFFLWVCVFVRAHLVRLCDSVCFVLDLNFVRTFVHYSLILCFQQVPLVKFH